MTVTLLQEKWTGQAACLGKPTDLFFGEPDGAGRPSRDTLRKIAEGKVICALCPVLIECRNYALDNRIYYGLWGGLSQSERRVIIRHRNRREAQSA